MKARRRLAGVAALCLPQPALAHSPIPGIEGFYVGFLHPFSTPSQALLMIGLGLLVAGLRQSHYAPAFGTFVLVMFTTLLTARQMPGIEEALFGMAAAVGALAALWPRMALPLALAAVAGGAVLIGQASLPDPGIEEGRAITMTGSLVGATVGLLYLVGATAFVNERYDAQWLRIAFRILAAWLAAISLVMWALNYAG